MSAYILPGMTGLMMGLLLHWAGFSRSGGVRAALSFRRSYPLRSGMAAIGLSLILAALLMWLAVIDVDDVIVLPLSAGALAGGVIMGVAMALCGATPTTAFAMLGGGNIAEALSTLAGCLGMALLLPALADLLAPLHTAAPYADATLFRVTLDESWLLGGGFAGLGCQGLLLWVIALCLPSPRPLLAGKEAAAVSTEPEAPAVASPAPVEEEEAVSEEAASPEEPAPDAELAPGDEPAAEEIPPVAPAEDPAEDAAADTFVSLQEGEEPLVVDTDPAAEEDENKSGK